MQRIPHFSKSTSNTTTRSTMPYANSDISDTEKLYAAFQDVLSSFGSVDAILEAFGLASMPTAQRYGILFGFLVFCGTVSSVLILLVFGGSFKRIQEQALTGESTILTAGQARKERALLYEELLEARQRMVQDYETSSQSPLLHLLLNQAPSDTAPPHLIMDENKAPKKRKEKFVPPLYKENYVKAYRRCQDRPGGEYNHNCLTILNNVPSKYRNGDQRPTGSPIRSLRPRLCRMWYEQINQPTRRSLISLFSFFR